MPNFFEWGQFGIMKVGCLITVIRILTFNKIKSHKFGKFAPSTNFLFYSS